MADMYVGTDRLIRFPVEKLANTQEGYGFARRLCQEITTRPIDVNVPPPLQKVAWYIALAVGVSAALTCIVGAFHALIDRHPATLVAAAILITALTVMLLFMTDKALPQWNSVHFDNATNKACTVSIDGITFMLPAKTRAEVELTCRTYEVNVVDRGGRQLNKGTIDLIPRSTLVFNIGGANTYFLEMPCCR